MSSRSAASATLFAAMLIFSSSVPAAEGADPERETMESVRAIAGALLSRQIDEQSGASDMSTPPRAALRPGDAPNLVRMPPAADRLTYQGVLELLQPREDVIYLPEIPTVDAWGERLEVYYDQSHVDFNRVVTVRSSGANRRFDAEIYEPGSFVAGDAIDDIVIADKRFVRWPRGVPEEELLVKEKP